MMDFITAGNTDTMNMPIKYRLSKLAASLALTKNNDVVQS